MEFGQWHGIMTNLFPNDRSSPCGHFWMEMYLSHFSVRINWSFSISSQFSPASVGHVYALPKKEIARTCLPCCEGQFCNDIWRYGTDRFNTGRAKVRWTFPFPPFHGKCQHMHFLRMFHLTRIELLVAKFGLNKYIIRLRKFAYSELLTAVM